MIQKQIGERPRWITMNVPVLRYTIRTPKKISKLVYQLNFRGFKTKDIRWGEPIEIDFDSFDVFIKHVRDARRCGKREIYDFYEYLIKKIDFKLKVHPFIGNMHEPVIVTLLLPHSQIKKFETMFYNAFIRHTNEEKKINNKYNQQSLDEQHSE